MCIEESLIDNTILAALQSCYISPGLQQPEIVGLGTQGGPKAKT